MGWSIKDAKKKAGDLTKLKGNDVSNALKAAKPYAATAAGIGLGVATGGLGAGVIPLLTSGAVGGALAYRSTKTKESQKTLNPVLKPLRDFDKNNIRPIVDGVKGALGGGDKGGGRGPQVDGVGMGNDVMAAMSPEQKRQISVVDAPTFDPRFKNAQTGLLTQLQDRAAGRGGPSLAEMQQKQAGNKAMQNTLGAVRAGTGSNAALAARTAALSGGNQMANLANESAMMRMREQQDAQNAVAGLAAQGRQGGIAEAGLNMDSQKLNQASDLSQQNMLNENRRAELASRTQLASSAMSANAQPQAAAGPSALQKVLPAIGAGVGTAIGGPIGGVIGQGAGAIASDSLSLTGTPAPTPEVSPAIRQSAARRGTSFDRANRNFQAR